MFDSSFHVAFSSYLFHVDLAHPDHPAVSIEVSSDARIAETVDGCYLDASVTNNLPCVSIQAIKSAFAHSLPDAPGQ